MNFVMQKIFKHPLFSGGLIMVGGTMGVNAINYAYHLIMGRVLGPVDYGVLASLYSLLYLVAVVPNSASVAIVKFIASAKNESEVASIYSNINRFVFKLALILSVFLLFISPLVTNFLHINDIKSVASLSFILFFSLIALVNQASSQGLLKFIGYVGPGLVSALAKLIVGLALILLGWSVFGAMVGVSIGAVLSYIYSTWYFKRQINIENFFPFNLKPFLKYSLPVVIQALAFTSLFTTDLILVKHFLTPFEAGIYAALSTLGKIIFFAVSPIAATMFPLVSKKHSRKENFQKIFWLTFGLTFLVSLIVVLFYWLYPDIAIGVLYGKAYLVASEELVWMGVFILFYSLSSFLVNFYLSVNKVKIILLPLAFSIIQIVSIWFFHSSILQVIQISMMLTTFLLLALLVPLVYNFKLRREI